VNVCCLLFGSLLTWTADQQFQQVRQDLHTTSDQTGHQFRDDFVSLSDCIELQSNVNFNLMTGRMIEGTW